MSEDEIVASLQRAYAAISRGDFDTAVEIADPDIEVVTPGLSTLRGADEFRAWMEPATFENPSLELESFEFAGDDVLVRHHARARGVASGINIDARFWVVWTFNEQGRVSRVVGFRDDQEAKARQTAGLSE